MHLTSKNNCTGIIRGYFLSLLLLSTFIPLFFAPPSIGAENDSTYDDFISKPWKGDFDAMVKKREIRVLLVYSKTFYFLDKGQQMGLTYDLMKQFEKFVNKKVGSKTLNVRVVFIPVRRDQLLTKLAEGYGDIAAANLTITDQRKELVDFSNPLGKGINEVVVTHSGGKQLQSFDDMEGREVYVRKSSSYYQSLQTLNNLFVKTGRKPMKIVAADETFEDEDILEMLNANLISTTIVDSHKAHFWEKIFKNIKVHDNAAVHFDGEIAWAIRKNSPRLAAVVNEFVKQNKKGTLVGNLLFNRYLQETDYIKNSSNKKDMERFAALVALFKKYGEKYNFDYLMLGAQAYQESGLDQSKKSASGAVGIMQVLPTTAKSPQVAIPDIHLLDSNVHAGTKYMRYLTDQFFADKNIDDLNKMLFSFAAYNAGPSMITKVRARTKKMGLNPNIWFHNTEVAAAKMIGKETVQYVANIYKYYIAYKMVVERMKEKKESIAELPSKKR